MNWPDGFEGKREGRLQDLNPIEWALLPLKKYAVFRGRAPRAEYWWFYLGTLVVSLPLQLIDYLLATDGLFDGIFSVALVVPWVAVSVRRLHDTDRSGWWMMALALPGAMVGYFAVAGGLESLDSATPGVPLVISVSALVVGALVLFIFSVLPGNDGPNRYGPDPYGPDTLEEVFA